MFTIIGTKKQNQLIKLLLDIMQSLIYEDISENAKNNIFRSIEDFKNLLSKE